MIVIANCSKLIRFFDLVFRDLWISLVTMLFGLYVSLVTWLLILVLAMTWSCSFDGISLERPFAFTPLVITIFLIAYRHFWRVFWKIPTNVRWIDNLGFAISLLILAAAAGSIFLSNATLAFRISLATIQLWFAFMCALNGAFAGIHEDCGAWGP
ncbi:MAG: hypothetical protein KC777_07890 [Cyanobacteria bacterium HKST-UBA02]|nr:hypothetical protein [Cyanobacteria bacterium HKST-UBA02]